MTAGAVAASITGGCGMGLYTWETRHTSTPPLRTLRNVANAVGSGILAGMCTGPFFFPLVAGAYYSARENTFKVLECSTKEKVVMQATEELKDKVIRHMNAGRRSRGLQPRFEDPPALVRWEIYPSK